MQVIRLKDGKKFDNVSKTFGIGKNGGTYYYFYKGILIGTSKEIKELR